MITGAQWRSQVYLVGKSTCHLPEKNISGNTLHFKQSWQNYYRIPPQLRLLVGVRNSRKQILILRRCTLHSTVCPTAVKFSDVLKISPSTDNTRH